MSRTASRRAEPRGVRPPLHSVQVRNGFDGARPARAARVALDVHTLCRARAVQLRERSEAVSDHPGTGHGFGLRDWITVEIQHLQRAEASCPVRADVTALDDDAREVLVEAHQAVDRY